MTIDNTISTSPIATSTTELGSEHTPSPNIPIPTRNRYEDFFDSFIIKLY